MSVITDEFDRVYIAKYFEKLGVSELSKSFETTNSQIMKIVEELKIKGLYKYYKDMPEEEWENLSGRPKRRQKELITEGLKKFQKDLFYKMLDTFKEDKPVFERYYNLTHMPEIKTTGEDEEWKEIKGFNYSISNYGMIKNNTTGRIKALRNGIWGYQVNLWNKGQGKMFTISRVVANYFIRPVKENERVIHLDGQTKNNYYKNLEIVSK